VENAGHATDCLDVDFFRRGFTAWRRRRHGAALSLHCYQFSLFHSVRVLSLLGEWCNNIKSITVTTRWRKKKVNKIKANCTWCVNYHGSVTFLFSLSFFFFEKKKKMVIWW
jgi:hypothetical protein